MSEDLNIDNIENTEELHSVIIKRCDVAGIEFKIKNFSDRSFVSLGIPNGRDKRWIMLNRPNHVKDLLNTEFENFVFLGEFLAVANYLENSIEATVSQINGLPMQSLHNGIFGEYVDGDDPEPIILEEEYLGSNIKVELGEASEIIKLFTSNGHGRRPTISIKISGINISQHDKGLEILKKISDSLFFQLDLQHSCALTLVRDRRYSRGYGHRSRRSPPERFELEFPKIEFDEGPISLYWYARSAIGMPLLQFLAFYQVIEYYYPTYSQEEAKRRIRSILKDPTFRKDRDGDIGKVLTAVTRHGRGFGDERAQLRATINACIDPNELRCFLTEENERSDFFSSKQKGLTDHKLIIKNNTTDLRGSVADLIYDIRCKIVHTKGESSEGEVELLLPLSKEAELLFYDIELMQYIARKVLIDAGAPLSL